jgi:hypothetical protein
VSSRSDPDGSKLAYLETLLSEARQAITVRRQSDVELLERIDAILARPAPRYPDPLVLEGWLR